MTKMTYAMAIDNAIALFSQGGQVDAEDKETVEKLEALKIQLAKRNKGERKPTKTQRENESMKEDILAALAEVGAPVTIKGLCDACEAVAGLSNQRITHMLTDLRKDGKVARTYVKKVAYFALGNEDEGE